MKTRIASCALAALVLCACASTDPTTDAAAAPRVLPHEREMATGSNMTRRTPTPLGPSEVKTVTREEMERNLDRSMILPPKER